LAVVRESPRTAGTATIDNPDRKQLQPVNQETPNKEAKGLGNNHKVAAVKEALGSAQFNVICLPSVTAMAAH
jgi:hypothetical protein